MSNTQISDGFFSFLQCPWHTKEAIIFQGASTAGRGDSPAAGVVRQSVFTQRRMTDRPEDRLWQTTVSCHRRRVASKQPRARQWQPPSPPFRDEPRCLEGALAECEIHVALPQRRIWRRVLFCCLRRQSERILTTSCWGRKKRREEEGHRQLSSAW